MAKEFFFLKEETCRYRFLLVGNYTCICADEQLLISITQHSDAKYIR